MTLCSYGCGQEAVHQFQNGKWCCSLDFRSCPEVISKRVKKMRGRTKENHEGRRKQAEKLTGRTKETHEGIRRTAEKTSVRMKNGGAVYAVSFVTEEGRRRQAEKASENQRKRLLGKTWVELWGEEVAKKLKEKQSLFMRNGHAARMRKQIKRFSKGELKLRGIVKELHPTIEHTYQILNYDVDIAILEYKIAIEYDGWHHFNIPGRKEYDEKRQQEIEQEGWKFLRYNIFQRVPTPEQVKEDIQNLLKEK